ncbi:MAG: Fe-S cluster assembly protein SufD [Bacteroides sp.]|nr:Fe-S cluster assembly protein SufD [Bacteroides sp.]
MNQYSKLYSDNIDALGHRQKALEAFEQREQKLDPAFEPETYAVNLRRLKLPVDASQSFKCAVPAVSTAPALIVNDIFQPPKRLPEGVTFMSLRAAAELHPELIPASIRPQEEITAESALNDLLWTDGALIRIGRNVKLERPLQLVNILAAPMDLMSLRRIIIIAETGSEAAILLCDHTQDSQHNYLVNELIEVTLEQGARLSLDRVEESSPLTIRHSEMHVNLSADARFSSTSALLFCGDSNSKILVNLPAPGAEARINGMVIASGTQTPGFHTRINHQGEHTSSNQTFKFVADGQSHCAFDGLIKVMESARFTEAFQTNHNLLASPDARMHAEPALEIYCDDVKCSHGATTGQLDDSALFYMRSRGIPEDEARRMLMEAFLADVIASVNIESLRDRLRHLVQRRFSAIGSGNDSCATCSALTQENQ